MTSATAIHPPPAGNYATDDDRWQALVARDRTADGCFVYSVRTTGVFCRPSCGARLPLRANVRFHATPEDARRAGFRPCKRCRPERSSPTQHNVAVVAAACRQIETADDLPTLQELADGAGLSRFHFHRLFKSVTGVTPKTYAAAQRRKRARSEITRKGPVTASLLAAGYSSSSQFYASSVENLGMTPTDLRAGGRNSLIRFAVGQCSLGAILVAATDKGICEIALGDDPERLVQELQDRFPNARFLGGDPEFETLVARVVGLVENPRASVDLPLDIRGTAFQQRVWDALRKIPPGSTVSYAGLAKRLGRPSGARAVASACAANKLAVAIPCHRVVRTDGSLSGYRWGIDRKQQLLAREHTRDE